MQDPYGNYVVQYILGICSREEAEALVHVPIGKVRTKTGSKKILLVGGDNGSMMLAASLTMG